MKETPPRVHSPSSESAGLNPSANRIDGSSVLSSSIYPTILELRPPTEVIDSEQEGSPAPRTGEN